MDRKSLIDLIQSVCSCSETCLDRKFGLTVTSYENHFIQRPICTRGHFVSDLIGLTLFRVNFSLAETNARDSR